MRLSRAGVAAARNAGLAAAQGEWIGFVDQDDEWVSGRLEGDLFDLAEARARGEPALWSWSLTRHKLAAGATLPLGFDRNCLARPDRSLLLGAGLFHRSCFERAGRFDERYEIADDLVWFQCLRDLGLGPVERDAVALVKHRHGANFSYDRELLARERLRMAREWVRIHLPSA